MRNKDHCKEETDFKLVRSCLPRNLHKVLDARFSNIRLKSDKRRLGEEDERINRI